MPTHLLPSRRQISGPPMRLGGSGLRLLQLERLPRHTASHPSLAEGRKTPGQWYAAPLEMRRLQSVALLPDNLTFPCFADVSDMILRARLSLRFSQSRTWPTLHIAFCIEGRSHASDASIRTSPPLSARSFHSDSFPDADACSTRYTCPIRSAYPCL